MLRADVLPDREQGRGLVISSEARGAWRELEGRLRPYVARRVASPCDVDDVVQEVFVRIHGGADRLADSESFGGWVYRIAERAVIDHRRRSARHPLVDRDDASEESKQRSEPDAGVDDAERDALQRELAECVVLFVAMLPSPYREAIVLTEIEGRTQREAAEMLGISLSGMKSRVQRGRRAIRELFEACCAIAVDTRGRVVECVPRGEGIASDCSRKGCA